MKGIILAAGKGTRLYPITLPVCKPLLPVYDKPMIYYPLSALMNAGIREILIIVPEGETETFRRLFGDGEQLGISIQYQEQRIQRGIVDAFCIGEEFIGGEPVCLALGDNIFFGPGFRRILRNSVKRFRKAEGAQIFGYYVNDPRPFGVVEFDQEGQVISLEEKPLRPKSHYIVPGLYFYDGRVSAFARAVEPSARGELEITSLNMKYLEEGSLRVRALGSDFTWIDAGTADRLYQAAGAIRSAERSGLMIGCIEEIALNNHWITIDQVDGIAEEMSRTKYGQYLHAIVEDMQEDD